MHFQKKLLFAVLAAWALAFSGCSRNNPMAPGANPGAGDKMSASGLVYFFPFICKWGSQGTGPGMFNSPSDVAVTASYAFVADKSNHRIQKFDLNGNFIKSWGTHGSGDNQFDYPYGVAIDNQGHVLVADTGNNRVVTYDQNGAFLGKSGSLGSGMGQFSAPTDICEDPNSCRVFVADRNNGRIQVLDGSVNHNYIYEWKLKDNGKPFGVGVDQAGHVYVTDTVNHRLIQYSVDGHFLNSCGTRGSGSGQFNFPYCVDTVRNGASDYVYVCDYMNARVQKFDSGLTYKGQWGSDGTGNGQFHYPWGIAVKYIKDAEYIFIAETLTHRIQKFKSSWTWIF